MTETLARTFHYGGLDINVSCNDPLDLQWLELFLSPWLDGTGGAAETGCNVELIADGREYQHWLDCAAREETDEIHCFWLDRGAVRLPSWTSDSGHSVVVDARLRSVYVVDAHRSRVRIVTAPGNLPARFATMRVVRELTMEQARARGDLILHAACFSVGDDGFLVAGPKGAGKTSLLLGALLDRRARFVSNDRVALRFTAGATLAQGIPTLVSIRRQTLELSPELRLCFERASMGHWLMHESNPEPAMLEIGASIDLTPAQICAALANSPKATANVRAVLFPRADANGASPVVRLSAETAMQRLGGSGFGDTAAVHGERLFARLVERSNTAASSDATELARRVPSLECALRTAERTQFRLDDLLAADLVTRPTARGASS